MYSNEEYLKRIYMYLIYIYSNETNMRCYFVFLFLKSGCNRIHITDLALSDKTLMIMILSFIVN